MSSITHSPLGKTNLALAVRPDVKASLEELARRQDRSVSSVVRRALGVYLEAHGELAGAASQSEPERNH